jgi:hypothetical protein
MEIDSASETFPFRILYYGQSLENLLEPTEGKSYLVDLGADGTIIILQKRDMRKCTIQWQDLVKKKIQFWILQKERNFITRMAAVSSRE